MPDTSRPRSSERTKTRSSDRRQLTGEREAIGKGIVKATFEIVLFISSGQVLAIKSRSLLYASYMQSKTSPCPGCFSGSLIITCVGNSQPSATPLKTSDFGSSLCRCLILHIEGAGVLTVSTCTIDPERWVFWRCLLDRSDQVVFHSGLAEDRDRAAKLIKMVSERYGDRVNVSRGAASSIPAFRPARSSCVSPGARTQRGPSKPWPSLPLGPC